MNELLPAQGGIFVSPSSAQGGIRRRESLWSRAGGGSLSLSVLLHTFLILAAIMWVATLGKGMDMEKGEIDIPLSGGGEPGKVQAREARLKRAVRDSTPRVIVAKSSSDGMVILPGAKSEVQPLPAVGRQSASGGLGGGGAEGIGFGGHGTGFGPGGAAGYTSRFMEVGSRGSHVILCIDTSGSMSSNLGESGIAALRAELKKSIGSLPPSFRFNLVCFGQKADLFRQESTLAGKEAKAEALRFLDWYFTARGRTRTEVFGNAGKDDSGVTYVPIEVSEVPELAGTTGGSRIDLAVLAAAARKPDTIFLMSDGVPGTRASGEDNPMSRDRIMDIIRDGCTARGGSAMMVNTISVKSAGPEAEEGAAFLKRLARIMKGKHREVGADKIQ